MELRNDKTSVEPDWSTTVPGGVPGDSGTPVGIVPANPTNKSTSQPYP